MQGEEESSGAATKLKASTDKSSVGSNKAERKGKKTTVPTNMTPQKKVAVNARRRKQAAVRGLSPFIISHRERSCFCQACVTGEGECPNRAFVGAWKEVSLKKQTRRKGKPFVILFFSPISNY